MQRNLVLILVLGLLALAACTPAQATTPPGMQIPSLTLPEGASPHGGGGGGGGGGRQQSEEAAFEFASNWSLDQIHRHFADQLEADGWQVRSEEGSEAKLVTFWEVFDEAGRTWAAKLVVEQRGDAAPYEYMVTMNMLTP